METRTLLNYGNISVSFESNLDSIQHLNEILFKLYAEYIEQEIKKLEKIKIEPESDYDLMIEIFDIMIDVENPKIQQNIDKLSPKSRETLKDVMGRFTKKIQTESFLRKMSITHLIIMFEEFLKRNLKLAYLNNPEILKSDQKLSFEDIIVLKDYDLILEEMIERKSRSIIKKDINEIGKFLEDFFKFELIKDIDWEKFAEVFYRRHVIVHNKGFSDEEYVKHTRNSTDVNLTPDEEYIKKSLELFRKYAQKITSFFEAKYPDPK